MTYISRHAMFETSSASSACHIIDRNAIFSCVRKGLFTSRVSDVTRLGVRTGPTSAAFDLASRVFAVQCRDMPPHPWII